MKNNKFIPETDFEMQNADLIRSLQNMEEEELSGDFDNKLFAAVRNIQLIRPVKTEKKSYRKLWDEIVEKLKINPTLYLSFASLMTVLCVLGYFYFNSSSSRNQAKSQLAMSEKRHAPGQMHGQISNNQAENKTPEKTITPDKNDRYYAKIQEKVVKNMNYGFLNNPGLSEIKKTIRSKEFKKNILQYSNPEQEDTVIVIIKILAEKM